MKVKDMYNALTNKQKGMIFNRSEGVPWTWENLTAKSKRIVHAWFNV